MKRLRVLVLLCLIFSLIFTGVKPIGVKAAKKDVTGADVITYAKKFVGNKYKYNGSSLTSGCDCSHFVYLVYNHFFKDFEYCTSSSYISHKKTTKISGIKVKSGTNELDTASLDKLNLGDIIVWDGHVAMYAGNHKIIHAQDSAHGICITKASSGHKFLGVVRVKALKGNGKLNSSDDNTGKFNKNWCKVKINQNGVKRGSGCTVVTLQLLLQNSATLPSNLQLNGTIKSKTKEYSNFDSKCSGFYIGDNWVIGSFASTATKISNAKWSNAFKPSGSKNAKKVNYNTVSAVVGLGNKTFKSMTKSEHATAVKAFWNAGYFCTFCVTYTNDPEENNGPKDYKANHATMLAGVDGNDIYINDPASGEVKKYTDKSISKYKLQYMICFKNDKTKSYELAGGKAASKAEITDEDKNNANNLGIPQNLLTGCFTEDEISSYARLSEVNIQEKFLNDTKRSNLDQNSTENITNWERNVRNDKKESGLVSILRYIIVFIGILFIIWAILVYIAYWFDKINNLFYIEALNIVTFGRLHVSGDENESNYNILKEGTKSVNHKNIVFICITAILMGLSLITGLFYRVVACIINFVLGFIGRF